MAKLLKKPWKESRQRENANVIERERQMRIRAVKRDRSLHAQEKMDEIKRKKREYFQQRKERLEARKGNSKSVPRAFPAESQQN